MALPFSPRDIDGLAVWQTASASQVEFWPGSTTRIAKWKDRHSGDFPYVANNHYEAELPELYRVPSLSSASSNQLAGRATIAASAGQYLIGRTMAWTANSGAVDPLWWNGIGAEFPNGREPSEVIPASSTHSFLLCRFLPPTAVGPSDSSWTALRVQLGFGSTLKPRPCVWVPDFNSRYAAGVEINLWDPANPTSPGELRFFADANYTYKYPVISPAVVPFSRFGQWTLLEIISTTSLAQLLINGVLAATVSRNSYTGSINAGDLRPCFFAGANNSGAWAEPRLACGGGNLAEHLIFRGTLATDDAHRVRAWLLQRWDLQSLIPLSNPYRAGVIPGSNPEVSRAFPGLRPSSRTFTPGSYANTPFGSIGGVEKRVRHSSTGFAGDRLKLQFTACSEAEAQAFKDHYALMQGGFKTFGLHPDALTNLGPVARHLNDQVSRAELAPRGSSWRYAGPLEIRDQQLNINDVVLELELVREPLGLILNGDPASTEMKIEDSARLFYGQRFAVGGNYVQVAVGDQTLGWERSDQGFGQAGALQVSVKGALKAGFSINGTGSQIEVATDGQFIYGPFLEAEGPIAIEANSELLYSQILQADAAQIRSMASLGWDLEGEASLQITADAALIETAAPDWVIASTTGAPFLGSTAASITTGWTTIISSKFDDAAIASGSFDFNVRIDGTFFAGCFIGSNGYVTFGSGSSAYSISASNPSVPKVLFYPGDRAYFGVYTRAGTGTGGKFFKIRWEGADYYTSSSSDSYVEITFFERRPANASQFIEVRTGVLPNSGNLAIANASTYYATGTSSAGSSYLFTGNATGTSWTLESGKSITHSL